MLKKLSFYISFVFISFCGLSCHEPVNAQHKNELRKLTQEFKDYWYTGTAEISTYELSENRYGEIRKGKAALIFVTEDFLPEKQVKANHSNPDNISVLKLNSVKKFTTGLYPYSIMQSSFLPLQTKDHALKITTSVQEWCGQTFIQLNNKKDFEINAFSYFESEGDQKINLPKTYTENELWNLIRLEGLKKLPIGEINLIPSFEFIRLKHKEIKVYKAKISASKENNLITYKVVYPELDRTLIINFEENAPYIIESWSEKIGNNKPSNAKRIITKKLPYWSLNANKHQVLRNEFGL